MYILFSILYNRIEDREGLSKSRKEVTNADNNDNHSSNRFSGSSFHSNLAWCKELKYDLTNMFFYFPKNFKKVHDRTAAEYQAVQDKKAAEKKRREEERIKREAEVMKKLLEEMLKENAGIDNAFLIKGKGLILRVPRDTQEIKNEGAALHHCVGTYVDRVAKGQTHIFFVRRVEEPDTPYFTMEYNNGRVIQCRGNHNCGMPASVKAFVAAFEKLMKEREEKMERKCG